MKRRMRIPFKEVLDIWLTDIKGKAPSLIKRLKQV